MLRRVSRLTPEDLQSPEYAQLARFRHAELADFVIEYFLRRTSWVTRVHHAMSIVTVAAIVTVAIAQNRGVLRSLGDFTLGLVTLFAIVLPLHELVHAAAYRVTGARDIRWGGSARMLAVWVLAHRFVAGRAEFLFVALAPFVLLNAAILAAAVAVPSAAVYLLCVLLWHLHGAAGDWALINFVWLHRERGFWTYDDAQESYFYGRSLRE